MHGLRSCTISSLCCPHMYSSGNILSRDSKHRHHSNVVVVVVVVVVVPHEQALPKVKTRTFSIIRPGNPSLDGRRGTNNILYST